MSVLGLAESLQCLRTIAGAQRVWRVRLAHTCDAPVYEPERESALGGRSYPARHIRGRWRAGPLGMVYEPDPPRVAESGGRRNVDEALPWWMTKIASCRDSSLADD